MLSVEDFQDPNLKNIVIKINKFLEKGKTNKVEKKILELEELLTDDNIDLNIPITYIFSIFAENNIEFITEDILEKSINLFDSEDEHLKTNGIIIAGFYALKNPERINELFKRFLNLIQEKSDDVKENVF